LGTEAKTPPTDAVQSRCGKIVSFIPSALQHGEVHSSDELLDGVVTRSVSARLLLI
jgi:hypothetical protein